MIEGLVGALGVLFEWPNPAWIVLGVLFGMLIGFLPGMAGSVALALLIPASFAMDPEVAVLFLIGAYSPAGFGGMLTSILVNTPGAPENAATTFDGYPMAQQGRAGAAIGAATAASVLGGLLGTAVLLALIPPAKSFVLAFSYPEFFAMALLGLTVIAVMTERDTFKGLIAGGVGFLLAFIGLDPITGGPRFTFGMTYLWDGLNIVPVLIGLFAGAEVLALYGKGRSIAEQTSGPAAESRAPAAVESNPPAADAEPVLFRHGVAAAFRHWFLIVRSSVIGSLIGVVPGVGGAVSGFLAYSHAKQTSRKPERFGRGSVEGVIAAESANDAKEGGSLLPTVAFGIPGTVGMAVLLGALVMHGVPAGPTLMVEHADLVYVLVIGMVASKFIAPVVVWLLAGQAVRLTRLRPGLFTPLIAVAALVGAYTIRLDILDVVLTVVFGYIGYAMRRYGFSRVALIIALVLGELVERSYYQTVGAFGGPAAILSRPISGVLTALSLAVVGYAVIQAVRRRRATTHRGAERVTAAEVPAVAPQPGRIAFDVLLLGYAVTIVVLAWSIPSQAATMPLLIGLPVVVAMVVQLLRDLAPMIWTRFPGAGAPPPEFGPQTLPSLVGRGGAAAGPQGRRPTSAAVVGRESEVSAEVQPRPADVSTAAAPEPAAEPAAEKSERVVLRRQLGFAAWAAGFVALSAAVGFAVSMPVALVCFLRWLARESWTMSLLVSAGGWAFLYGLFGLLLGVPLG